MCSDLQRRSRSWVRGGDPLGGRSPISWPLHGTRERVQLLHRPVAPCQVDLEPVRVRERLVNRLRVSQGRAQMCVRRAVRLASEPETGRGGSRRLPHVRLRGAVAAKPLAPASGCGRSSGACRLLLDSNEHLSVALALPGHRLGGQRTPVAEPHRTVFAAGCGFSAHRRRQLRVRHSPLRPNLFVCTLSR